MRLTLTSEGMVKLMVLVVLEAVKENLIKAEYSGTIRKYETVVKGEFLVSCLDAFFQMSLESYPDFITQIDEESTTSNADTCISRMLGNGYLKYVLQHDVYLLNGLFLNNYYLATESNIQDNGVICWGKDGIGATYQGFDQQPVPFGGVTVGEYMKQFPRHRVSGNDLILSMAAADAVSMLIGGWDPKIQGLVQDFRKYRVYSETLY